MQEFQELMPDEETFRRVWQRVMPDESLSPVVLRRPGEEQNRPMPPGPQRPNRPRGDEDLLRQMLEETDRGLFALSGAFRRQPGVRGVWESLNDSAAQLRSAWFLLTGRRWRPGARDPGRIMPVGQLLREQYLRELELFRLYRTGEREFRGEDLRELMPELDLASRQRRGMIRRLLARG